MIIQNIQMHQTIGANSNVMSLSNEDYYASGYAYNQMTNHIFLNSNGPGGNNTGSNQMNPSSPHVMSNSLNGANAAYFHTLQSPHLVGSSWPGHSNQNSNGYMTPNSSSAYGLKVHHGHNGIITRSPSLDKGIASSSSSSSPASTSLSHMTSNQNQNNSSLGINQQIHNNPNLLVSPDASIDSPNNGNSPDYETPEKVNSGNTAASEQAELIRQKQLRGCALTQEELQLLAKDRQRKDNHNMSKLPFIAKFLLEKVFFKFLI